MPTDAQLLRLARSAGRALIARGARLATAESCTGGWIAKAITDVPGSSGWFDGGFIVYSNAAKQRTLGVPRRTLERHGAVSRAAVLAMAAGALRHSGADVALAISGIAGPDGGTRDKPVGTVWLALVSRGGRPAGSRARRLALRGDREAIRRASVAAALKLLLAAIG